MKVVSHGMPLGCSTLGVWTSGLYGGGPSSNIEDRVDRVDGASSDKEEGLPMTKGIRLMSREGAGGRLTGLGVGSRSGSLRDIRVPLQVTVPMRMS